MPTVTCAARGILDSTLLVKLSPLQRKIVIELASGPLTLSMLSERTGSSVYSVGKQLSLLQLRPRYNPLRKKGIEKPLIRKNKGMGIKTTYLLALEQPL